MAWLGNPRFCQRRRHSAVWRGLHHAACGCPVLTGVPSALLLSNPGAFSDRRRGEHPDRQVRGAQAQGGGQPEDDRAIAGHHARAHLQGAGGAAGRAREAAPRGPRGDVRQPRHCFSCAMSAISHVVPSSVPPPRTRRTACATECPCLLAADWCLRVMRSDGAPFLTPQAARADAAQAGPGRRHPNLRDGQGGPRRCGNSLADPAAAGGQAEQADFQVMSTMWGVGLCPYFPKGSLGDILFWTVVSTKYVPTWGMVKVGVRLGTCSLFNLCLWRALQWRCWRWR